MVVLAETVVVVCFWVDDGIVGSFCSGVGRGCDDTSISGSGNVVMIAVTLVMGRDCGGGAFFMIRVLFSFFDRSGGRSFSTRLHRRSPSCASIAG